MFIRSFESGLASEKKQLPCFLPYEFPYKDMLEKMYTHLKGQTKDKKIAEISTAATSSNQNLGQQLASPRRKILLKQHRQTFIELQNAHNDKNMFCMSLTLQNPPNSPQPPSLLSLEKITLKDMYPTENESYNGRVLEARIIDWSYLISGIATVIEDENGDVEWVSIYNWPKKDDTIELMKTFRPNCKISIINPFMRMSMDNLRIIRVNSPAYMILDDSLSEKKCYCCGKEAETMKCAKCLMSRYCSKECQKMDWIEFNHKDVCKYLKKYSTLL